MSIVRDLFARLGINLDEESFATADAALGGVKQGVLALGAIAKAAGMQLLSMASQTAEAGRAAQQAARQTGLSTDAVQELGYAAERSGLDGEQFMGVLSKLSAGAFKATHGSKELATAFYRMGISLYSGGKLKTSDELLGDLSDSLAKMQDPAARAALAGQILGEEMGPRLLPMLLKGRAGLTALRQEARDFGLVLDANVIASSKDWNDASKDLNAMLRGLSNAVGGPLVGALAKMVRGMADWLRANRGVIASGLSEAVKVLITALSKGRQLLDPFIAALGWLARQAWLLKTALAAVVLVGGVQLGAALMSGGAAAMKMLGTMRALTVAQGVAAITAAAVPLAWLTMAAVVALVVEDIYGYCVGKKSLLGQVVAALEEWIDAVKADPGLADDHPIIAFLLRVVDSIWNARENWKRFKQDMFGQKMNVFGSEVSREEGEKMLAGGAAEASKQGTLRNWASTALKSGTDKGDLLYALGQSGIPQQEVVDMRAAFGLGGSNTVRLGNTSSSQSSVSVTAPITINAAPGMSEEQVAAQTVKAVKEVLDTRMRETASATGGL